MAGLEQRIGVFGGSFDPPHLGHLILAAEALHALTLDRIFWVLTPDPPHKSEKFLSPITTRLALINAAIQDNPGFALSRVELERPGPHYTLDTIKILRQENPQAQLIYLIGGDSLHDFPSWHKPHELLSVLDGLGVMRRPGDQVHMDALERKLSGITKEVIFIDAPLLEISSREIRKRISQARPFRYFLSASVYRLILEKRYYLDS